MVLIGNLISIVAGIRVCVLAVIGVFLLVLALIYDNKVWKWYLIFPVFLIISFYRTEVVSCDFAYEPNEEYIISGKVNKVSHNKYYSQIYVYNPQFTSDTAENITGIIINYSGNQQVFPGDVITLKGKLSEYEVATNPGNFNSKAYYATMNIDAYVKASEVQIESVHLKWVEKIFKLRDLLIDVYEKIGVENDSGIYESIILGYKATMDNDVKELYQLNGIAHILAISGLHISIIGMGLYKFLRKCMVPFLPGFLICFVIIVSYGVMTGNSVSTIRAIIMFLMNVFAGVVGRKYDVLSAMSLCAIVTLLMYPMMPGNSGFWLSYLAVLGIVIIVPVFEKISENKILKLFYGSLAVNIATFPVILLSYFQFPLYSILLNLIVIPLMTILMISVAAAGLLGLFSLKAGAFCIGIAHYILKLYEVLCELVMKLPYSIVTVGKPQIWQVAIYAALIIITIILVMYCNEKAAVGFIVAMAIILIRFEPEFMMTMIDVGQGDSIFISSDGENMLIDGGSTSEIDVGKYRIIPFLKSNAVSYLDVIVVTHADADHISGIAEIFEENTLHVGNLIVPMLSNPSDKYLELIEKAQGANIPVTYIKRGDVFRLGNCEVVCMHPAVNYEYDSENDYSTVLQLTYKEIKILLTGDIEETGEYFMMKAGLLSDIDILKVAHHGSRYSSNKEFLSTVNPELALISCSIDNSYGHPHEETLMRLKMEGCEIWQTTINGAVTVYANEDDFYVEGYKDNR